MSIQKDKNCDERKKCLEHSRVNELISQVPELWKAVNAKVEKKLFYVLIGLVVGSLTFSWAIYERVGRITGEQGVFLERISNFMTSSLDDRLKLNRRVDDIEKDNRAKLNRRVDDIENNQNFNKNN